MWAAGSSSGLGRLLVKATSSINIVQESVEMQALELSSPTNSRTPGVVWKLVFKWDFQGILMKLMF
jgi:hypothetical protein